MKRSKFLTENRVTLVGLAFWVVGFSACLGVGQPLGWVSTSPQLTELLFQLDLGDRIVGTSEQSNYPPAAKKIRRIGQLFDPNLEAILVSQPTLVLWDGSSWNPKLESHLASLGIPSLKISLDSVEEVFKTSIQLVQKFKAGKKSDDLIRAEIEWDNLKKINHRFSFLAFAWGDPPIVFGENTFLFSFIEAIGGRGIVPSFWSKNYLKVSEEWLMAQKPDRVVYLKHDEASASFMTKQCEKWWPQQKVSCVGVSAEKFARASLTPFLFLSELKSSLEPAK